MIDKKISDIRFVVEFWEQDCLDIESNQHILFFFTTEYYDITVTKDNIERINNLLQKIDKKLKINLEFRVNFFDRIIYPINFYGERFYEYKYGNIINYILKTVGLNIPLIVREKWIYNNEFSRTTLHNK